MALRTLIAGMSQDLDGGSSSGSLPAGGATGTVLVKQSAADGDADWEADLTVSTLIVTTFKFDGVFGQVQDENDDVLLRIEGSGAPNVAEYPVLSANVSGGGVSLGADGAAANIDLNVAPKGAGVLFLGGQAFDISAAFTTTGTSGITLAAPSTGSPIVYTLPSVAASLAPLVSPSFTTPALGVATGTSIALGGATIGSHALAVTGTVTISGALTAASFSPVASTAVYSANCLVPGNFQVASASTVGWTATANPQNSADTILSRNAAGIVQVGTTAANALGSLLLTNLTASGTIKPGAYTFATLPTPATGMVAYITDCNTATYNATAAAGGANVVKVFYNGTNWVVA